MLYVHTLLFDNSQLMFGVTKIIQIKFKTQVKYLLTYVLTPCCRVLLEKQLVKKFPAFHGTRRFITALISVRHLSLSWGRPIQST